ncbi:MAG: ferrous iron transport protein A [Thermoplasmata archaeon]|nr:MAG: ferrous iron transport protein A [Thermoplasmata archaeon]
MLLSQLRPGDLAKIISIEGGYGLREKLTAMGLREGSIIRVISTHGPVVIELKRGMISIGRGMAHKIRVERL